LIRFLCVALAAAVVAPWLLPGPTPAYADALAANQHGVVALTAPGNGNGNNVLFLVDSQNTRLLVYEHRAGGKLELTAVRNYEYEAEFEQWPGGKAKTATQPPVGTMKEEADKLRQGGRRGQGGGS
jgi:hypothetical protein